MLLCVLINFINYRSLPWIALVIRLSQCYIANALFNIGKNSTIHLLYLIKGKPNSVIHEETSQSASKDRSHRKGKSSNVGTRSRRSSVVDPIELSSATTTRTFKASSENISEASPPIDTTADDSSSPSEVNNNSSNSTSRPTVTFEDEVFGRLYSKSKCLLRKMRNP